MENVQFAKSRPMRWYRVALVVFALLSLLPLHAGFKRSYEQRQPWESGERSLWESVEGWSFDLFSTLAPPAIDSEVVLVTIDGPSMEALQQTWPWPRDLHAQLIRRLHAAGARVIALDLLFDLPKKDHPEEDAALAAAIREGGPVVLVGEIFVHEDAHFAQASVVGPHPELLEAGAQVGIGSVIKTGVLRELPSPETLPDAFARTILRAAGERWTRDPPEALIQFFGPPGSLFPRASYYQALDPERYLPPEFFRGKLVLVGLDLLAAAEIRSSADRYTTPFTLSTSLTTAGVEVHATILENLRLGLAIAPLATDRLLAVLALLVVASAFFNRRFHPRNSTLLLLAAMGGVLLFSFFLLQELRIWLPPPLLLLGLFLPYLAHGANSVYEERAQRHWLANAFSRYVSPQEVQVLLRDPSRLKLGGELKELTVLFLDIRGFTTLSEAYQSDPQGLTRLINNFFTPMTAVILAQHGTIDKYIGDSIMAFWNAPADDSQHARNACRAALGMVQTLHRFNADLASQARAQGREPLRIDIGIGINTGRCVVGNLGSEQRFDYSVLGDAVNLASRLEGASKSYGVRIVVGPQTAAAVAEEFTCLELDLIAVKGKAEAVRIFTVLERSALPDESRATLLSAQAALLAAYRAGDFAAARAALLLARTTGELPALFDLYEQRIAQCEAHPPQAPWNGVYVAKSK